MSITMYGLAQCGTCKKAMAWLDGRGLAYRFIDYRAEPVDADTLRAWAGQIGWEKLVNRTSMTWRALPDARKTPGNESDWLALIAEFPALVRRPVAVSGDQVSVGFTEKSWAQRFGS